MAEQTALTRRQTQPWTLIPILFLAGIGHDESLLRQVFVHRAGHGNFTSAETIAVIQALIRRLDTGEWEGVDAEDMNDAASKLPRAYDFLFFGAPLSSPVFVHYQPALFQRPFDGSDRGARRSFQGRPRRSLRRVGSGIKLVQHLPLCFAEVSGICTKPGLLSQMMRCQTHR